MATVSSLVRHGTILFQLCYVATGVVMQVFLETERLILRQFIEEHADNLFKLDSDPEVMRFINRGLQQLERKAVKDGVSKDEFQL